MNIVSTQYTLSTSTLEIYFSGCKAPHCDKCCNPELQKFGSDNNYKEELIKIKNKIKEFNSLIDNIILVGGCPLDQNHDELIDFLKELTTTNKSIFLFTKYNLDEIPKDVKKLCDFIKCGRYIPSLIVEGNVQYGITLATSNQIIYKQGKDY